MVVIRRHLPKLYLITRNGGGCCGVICAASGMCWFMAGIDQLSACSLDEDEGLNEEGLHLF